jgi:SAM-dependent methyltransferase
MVSDPQEQAFLRGEALRGEGMHESEISAWYAGETEGYARLGAQDRTRYQYGYHGLNWLHGYRLLRNPKYNNVLGIGSAYGDEFLPIIEKIGTLTIIEPSIALRSEYVGSLPVRYVTPGTKGELNVEDGHFDLVTCFNVLHHLPNVRQVLQEIRRCVAGGGEVLLREPIVSLGDWRLPRKGLTKNERGIPLNLFRAMLIELGFKVRYESLTEFRPLARLMTLGFRVYNGRRMAWVDAKLSEWWRWNLRYHAVNSWQKIRPSSVAFVLDI